MIFPALSRASVPKYHISLGISVDKWFHLLWLYCVKCAHISEGMEINGRESEEQLKAMPFKTGTILFCSVIV